MDEGLDRRLRFLRAAGEMGHPGGVLLGHLLGTRRLLMGWGSRAALCDAGLFHSVYGTEHYLPVAVPPEMRAEVVGLIGEEAEWLAWLFCAMERESFDRNVGRTEGLCVRDRRSGEWRPLTRGQFSDLVALSYANTLEALPRLPWGTRRACRAYLLRLREAAPPEALRVLDATRWWPFWR
jgi:hypothetical protein